LRDQIKAKWIAAGATPEGAEGIVRAAEGESGLNPTRVGDDGTSFGLYQHHNDRAIRLLDFAKSQNKSPSDPLVQTDFAIKEATTGGDPMATQHRDSFMKASDPVAAKAAFSGYFERPASLGAMMTTPNGSFARQRMEALDREVSQLSERDSAKYDELANRPDPTAKERQELLTDARQRARHAREMYEDIAKNPPPEKPIDALANFGSIGSMLMLLIGGMGRHHMNGALAAAGAMMQAAQANNHELFERQYKIWDHRATMALNLSKLESDEVRDLLEDKRMSENERQSRLQTFYQEHDMKWHGLQTRAGLVEHLFSAEEAAARARDGVRNAQYQTGVMMAQAEIAQLDPNAPDYEKKVGDIYAKRGVLGPGAASAAREGGGAWSKDSMEALVQQAMRGDPGVMTSLPRSGSARKQFEEALAEKLKAGEGGIEGGAAQLTMNRLRMVEARAAATTAGHVTMNTEIFSVEAQKAGEQVIEASKLFPRTDIPRVNQALRAYETNTGDPNVIRFGVALNALVNAYGKMSNPTGTGIHDAHKERFVNLLDTKLSQGQIEAGVEQVITEGRIIASAAQQAQEQALGRLVPKVGSSGPDTVVPSPSASATPSPGVPVPTEHASDPDGTTYKGSDGKTYVKRGNQMTPQ
jgi:hypothetical protein